jgi:hypothetical protein
MPQAIVVAESRTEAHVDLEDDHLLCTQLIDFQIPLYGLLLKS